MKPKPPPAQNGNNGIFHEWPAEKWGMLLNTMLLGQLLRPDFSEALIHKLLKNAPDLLDPLLKAYPTEAEKTTILRIAAELKIKGA